MTAQNDAFRRKLRLFFAKARENQELVVRKVALDLLTSLIYKSPVDTGRFRGNWFVQQDTAAQTTEAVDTSGAETIARAQGQIARFRLGGTLYLVNHLPYGQPLEYGHSQQAPGGMVRITVAEFDQFITKAVGELKT